MDKKMAPGDPWDFINALDEELLKGGIIISEWAALMVREADLAFAGRAHLAALITAVTGIETHLRAEHGSGHQDGLLELTDRAPLPPELKAEVHDLRIIRNRWVHVRNAADDAVLLAQPERYDAELEEAAKRALKALRKIVYLNPMI